MSIKKQILIAIIVGTILSFFSNIAFLYIINKNGLPPFFHGGIKPNYYEIMLFGLIPILLRQKSNSTNSNNEFKFNLLGYLYIGICSITGWIIGTYEQTTFKMLDDPNDTFFLGVVGGTQWHMRQSFFLYGLIFGLSTLLILRRYFRINETSTNKR